MKKQNKKNKNKKSTNRRGNKYTTRENLSLSFLSPHKYITLKYTQIFTSSIATTVGTQQVFNLNGCFDPDRTGGGHQPYGWDQLTNLYSAYRPLHTRWKVEFGTQPGTYSCVVIPTNSQPAVTITTAATFQTVAEMPRAVVKVQGGTGAPTETISGAVNLEALAGVTKTEYLANANYEALINANPSEELCLTIGFYNTSASTTAVAATVTLWFTVDLHDPIALGSS
jgi:hypothetical protein